MESEAYWGKFGEFLILFREYVLLPGFNQFQHEELAIGLALGLVFLALVFGAWFYFRNVLPASITLSRLTLLVERCDGELKFKEAYSEIDEAFRKVKFLKHAWEEFAETLIFPKEDETAAIRNTQRPEQYLNSRAAERFGPKFHFYQALPNYFVGVGLLFTFFGLVAALYFASDGIKEGAELSAMQESLRKLLHAATFKFLTSIAGLFSSICLSVQYRLVTHKLQLKFDRLCDALEHRMTFVFPEILLNEQLKEQKAQTLQLERFNTDFAIELSNALEEKLNRSLPASVSTAVKPLTDAVDKMAGNLGSMNQDALSEMVGGFQESLQGSAGSEMTAITKALEGISVTLGSMSAGVNDASSDFGRRVEDAAIQLEKTVSSAGQVLKEQANEAASAWQEQIQSSAVNLHDAMRETSQTFSEQLLNASGEVGESLTPLAAQIGRFETVVSSLDSRLEAQRDALDGVVQNVKNAGAMFSETVLSLKDAGEPIARTADQFTKSAEDIRIAGQAISETQASIRELNDKIGKTSETLTESWGNYEERFKDVDESLAKVFNDLMETSEAHRAHIQEFVQELDKQFGNALKFLGSGIEQLSENVEELDQTAGKFTEALK